MKIRITIVVTLLMITFFGCKKDIDPQISFDSFTYDSTDPEAGTWKTVYLTSASQVPVNAPSDPTSPEYLAELAALKSQSANLSSSQQDKVNYWSTNGVIRWNEIARTLVAKYFLLPAPEADGTYKWPDGTHPDQYPLFPLSSPPYSCRAYAYLSAGSFDALISAWYYKYQYNRLAPSNYDASIATHLPVQDLPSYPSEDAVLAGFARTLLTNLFPLEGAYLTQMAKDQEDSRLWAGVNVTSDITAGVSLGKAIATIFIGRAKTDGMKFTIGNQAVWDSITNANLATGQPIWQSLEIPARPMLAPNFGHVLPWNFEQSKVTTEFRLPPPPAVGTPEFQTALDEVLEYSKHATKEEMEIAFKWDDGTSTYTPPGHWNYIAEPYIHDARMSPVRAARVLAYMNMAIQDAGITLWDNKYYYFFPRPTNINADIKTIMGVPGFPSYPSGHSAFSGAAASVLGYFFPSSAADFEDMAQEAAMSRLYGCIHYRFDCDEGLVLGKNVGQYAISRAAADGAQ
ncbi:MAG TPA: phosphatase PAP2 family protein [Chitinophagales bacterium]|nr:phosphatase PAP2 family protein [Chitinophagales bacterium]